MAGCGEDHALKDGRGAGKKRLPVVQPAEHREGWGLVKVAGGPGKRRFDCAHLKDHEEEFVRVYEGAQGRCPEDCGGHVPRGSTVREQAFAALLARRQNPNADV